jgi:hypothetical protein
LKKQLNALCEHLCRENTWIEKFEKWEEEHGNTPICYINDCKDEK